MERKAAITRNSFSSSAALLPRDAFGVTPAVMSIPPPRRCGLSDHFLGLVVGLAVAAQGARLGSGIKLLDAGRDLGVLALEQRIAGKIALDQERAEFFHVEHPDRLRQAKL